MAKKRGTRARSPLTPGVVQRIVIDNTPNPSSNPAPNTQLRTLGIVDRETAATHKAGIQSDIQARGFNITQADINSAPTTTVAACRDSVLTNASQ